MRREGQGGGRLTPMSSPCTCCRIIPKLVPWAWAVTGMQACSGEEAEHFPLLAFQGGQCSPMPNYPGDPGLWSPHGLQLRAGTRVAKVVRMWMHFPEEQSSSQTHTHTHTQTHANRWHKYTRVHTHVQCTETQMQTGDSETEELVFCMKCIDFFISHRKMFILWNIKKFKFHEGEWCLDFDTGNIENSIFHGGQSLFCTWEIQRIKYFDKRQWCPKFHLWSRGSSNSLFIPQVLITYFMSVNYHWDFHIGNVYNFRIQAGKCMLKFSYLKYIEFPIHVGKCVHRYPYVKQTRFHTWWSKVYK